MGLLEDRGERSGSFPSSGVGLESKLARSDGDDEINRYGSVVVEDIERKELLNIVVIDKAIKILSTTRSTSRRRR
jgi:hypothetical protein